MDSDFRYIFPIFDMLYGSLFVFRFTFLNVARKFAPPANLPGQGPADEVAASQQILSLHILHFITELFTFMTAQIDYHVLRTKISYMDNTA